MNYQDMFEAALKAEGVSGGLADLARSINKQESGGGKNTQTSNAGAQGGMQIIPGTFAEMADKGWDIKNPEHNARAGIRYIKQLDKRAGGNPALTAAGYYGGPGGLEKARKGIAVSDPRNPKAPTTLQYGQQVVARMGKAAPAKPSVLAMPDAQFNQLPAMPVQAPAPEMLAPAPVMEVAPQVMAQAPVMVPEEDPWAQFQNTLPRPVEPEQMAYGQPRQAAPAVMLDPESLRPNFKMFQPMKRMAA